MSVSRPCAVTTTVSSSVGWLAGDSAGGASWAKAGACASSPATIARASGEQRGRRWCGALRVFGAFMVFSASPGKKSKRGRSVAASFGFGQSQRAEGVQRVRRRGSGAVGRKGHGAVTETLQRLSQALPAAFAAAAHVGEVDLERDPLAPAAGLVDDPAAGPATPRTAAPPPARAA